MDDEIATAQAALREGRWQDALVVFDAILASEEHPAALAGKGDVCFWTGSIREGIEYRERAFAAYRRAGDVFWAAESAIWLCFIYGSSLGNLHAARGWVARAESVLAGEDAGQMAGWIDLCQAGLSRDPEASRARVQRAIATAREYGDTDLELCALSEMGVLLVKLGDVEEGLRCLDEAMAGALSGDHAYLDTVIFTSCSMLTACDILADLERAVQWCRAADEFTRTYGGPYLYAYCRTVYGRVLVMRGQWQQAEAELALAAASTRDNYPAMYVRSIVNLAELRYRQGRLDEAEALLEGLDSPMDTALVAAFLALRRGRPETAATLVERWLHLGPDDSLLNMHSGGRGLSLETASAFCLLVEANIECGRIDGAEAALQRLLALAESDVAGLIAAYAALGKGLICMATGDAQAAAAALDASMERFSRLELPMETARARLAAARARSESNPDLAIAEARQALSVFDRLGATGDADIAAALLRSWGVAGRTGPRDNGVLTRREQEILALIAAGLSNQEIADRLYISRKTASHHVSNLLAKLGVRNRAEAAAYASSNRTPRA